MVRTITLNDLRRVAIMGRRNPNQIDAKVYRVKGKNTFADGPAEEMPS